MMCGQISVYWSALPRRKSFHAIHNTAQFIAILISTKVHCATNHKLCVPEADAYRIIIDAL